MFELDDGFDEAGDALGEIFEEEAEETVEDTAEEYVEEIHSDNLLAHWNKKQGDQQAQQQKKAESRPVYTGPTIRQLLTQLDSQIRNLFGDRAQSLEVPMTRAAEMLRALFPPSTQQPLVPMEHDQLQKELHHTLNQLEDIMDALLVATMARS